jgi:hypothetical protein
MPMPKWLLALEVRASRVGFAVFEGPTRLLDWGVRSFEKGNKTLKSSASDRIATLLAFHRPFAIVLRARTCNSGSQRRALAMITNSIRVEAKRHSTKIIVLTHRQVQSCFAPDGQITKHDIAVILAKRFEELSWKLPLRRKSYQSEAPVMAVFDAVATGIAFFERQAPKRSDIPKEF